MFFSIGMEDSLQLAAGFFNLSIKNLWPLAAIAFLASCGTEPMQQAGTETGNGTSGMVVAIDGKPAIGARVTIVPVNYNELQPPSGDFMIATTVTDSFGRYAFNTPIPGYYNLFGESGVYKAYLDSVRFAVHQGDTIQTVALKKSGSVAGSAFYSSGRSIDFAYVALQGSRIYAAIDPNDGVFHLSNLAPGRYCAKVITRTNGYFDLPLTLSVEENHSDTMPTPFLLISNSVTSLMADTGGVWIGTANGLASFHNGNWRTYGLFNGLSSSRINCMATDPKGFAWIGTSLRLARIKNDTLTENIVPFGIPSIMNITALAADSMGNLWIGTPQGLFLYNGAEVVKISSSDALSMDGASSPQNELTAVSAILCLQTEIIVGTMHGVFYRDSGNVWNAITELADYAVPCMTSNGRNSVWIGTNQGLRLWDRTSRTLSVPADSVPIGAVSCLVVRGVDSVYAGSVNGLFLYSESRFTKIDLGAGNPSISALTLDSKGVLWVGTNDGILKISNGAMEVVR
jgi:ligand-binding sensor domain-containing protein